ncbi:DUF4279 domain-containing protein [Sphingomonas xinjiangensis]|uniref:DUF4279 domain-containing protein n=1 Tax=Sphingomonas xinjiangensis TaxID=643568 RepID=A0A840YTT2_9SPHN|nr:DUF4279 domain-containing protein [Sphingomonas xinjiangensis]MBB5713129.1 hypothetical protein [Sphingomonas xinjiangensis]
MTNVDQCKASLWLMGDALDPDKLAQSLDCTPAYGIRKGDIYLSENGEEIVASTGRFQITTGWRTGEPLDRVLQELLDQLPDDLASWAEINSTLSGKVLCGLILDSVNEEAEVPASVLLSLGQRGLSLHLDIYDSGDGPVT